MMGQQSTEEQRMATRFGVDVGGTFTDLVYYDDVTGEVRVAKEPTVPAAPDEGVQAVLRAGLDETALAEADFFLHGTTVALNALLERRGAVVGLLTTEGFRDVVAIRRGERSGYSLLWQPPEPLVPRRLRLGVPERVSALGEVVRPLDESAVADAVARFAQEGVTSVAIAFVNAYANPANEIAAEEALRRAGFEGEISVSHSVSGEYREYERTSTTLVDAYIRPIMSTYVGRLERSVREHGFGGRCYMTNSGGGAIRFADVGRRPFETIQSGPVAGVSGAAELCRQMEIADAITADVGGTSFDTALIVDGAAHVRYQGYVGELPVQTPWVDVRSIGAGGGSVAYVDEGGLLRVGPRSAGANPGPACYARGGVEPTVTDAAALLGMLGAGELAGGVTLDFERSRAAAQALVDRLGGSVESLAKGIMTIATATMANAIREITLDHGRDPRDAALIAFGGAGPMFAGLLAAELEIDRIVVPSYAGNFSAWGLLGQDIMRSSAATVLVPLDSDGLARVGAMRDELFARIAQDTDTPESSVEEVALDVRYAGQEHTLTVPVARDLGSGEADVEAVRATFAAAHERTYGHMLPDDQQVVAVRATVRTPLPRRAAERAPVPSAAVDGTAIDAYSFVEERRREFAVHHRGSLSTDETVPGPVIVLDETTTLYVDVDRYVRVGAAGALLVERA